MKLLDVTEENISELFELNKELAISEGQGDLFSSSYEDYKSGFIGDNPVACGVLCLIGEQLAGFAVFNYKFATYAGSRVLYIEDIFLREKFLNEENKSDFLRLILQSKYAQNCIRVEIRVMNEFSWGINLLEEFGFEKITKWMVYRKQN